MVKLILTIMLTCFLAMPVAFAKSVDAPLRVSISSSETFSLLYFLEMYAGSSNIPRDLGDWFDQRRQNSRGDRAALQQYRDALESQARKRAYGGTQSIEYKLEKLAAKSNSSAQFLQSAKNILDSNNFSKFKKSFLYFQPIYRKLIWQPSQTRLKFQVEEMQTLSSKLRTANDLALVKKVENSTWPSNLGFAIMLVPRPKIGDGGQHTVGHSNDYLEVMEMLPDDDAKSTYGRIFHELCHSLWEKRPEEFQRAFRSYFIGIEGTIVYQLMNETLATCLGSGWIDQKICPNDNWYGEHYINAYAHALCPTVLQYLDACRTFDRSFAIQAIKIFQEKFPGATSDPKIVFRNVLVYSEIPANGLEMKVAHAVQLLSSFNDFSPINSPAGLRRYRQKNDWAAAFLLSPKNLAALTSFGIDKQTLSALSKKSRSQTRFTFCTHTSSRWLIFCAGKNYAEQEKLLLDLVQQKSLLP